MPRSLIVLPDDSSRPILDAIAAAKKSLRIKMFVFSDPSLIAAVIAAQQRGVKVRVMLNPARRSGEAENQESRAALVKGKVSVEDSNPAFDLTHEKSMVVDDTSAFVKSLNWASAVRSWDLRTIGFIPISTNGAIATGPAIVMRYSTFATKLVSPPGITMLCTGIGTVQIWFPGL